MGTDVVGVHALIEPRLLQLAVYLWRHTRQNDVCAVLVVHLDEVLQVVDARTVNKRYATHAYDAHPKYMSIEVMIPLIERLSKIDLTQKGKNHIHYFKLSTSVINSQGKKDFNMNKLV